jgi:hypothetical protein
MKKNLLAAVTLAAAALTVPAMLGAAQAAPAAKSPFCSMAPAGNNGYAGRESWADYYHCWGGSAGAEHAAPVVHHTAGPAKSAFCNMAPAGNNGYAGRESWADYYHCWGR